MKRSVTFLDIYPSIARFRNSYCENCIKDCEVPSLEMFACVLTKLNKKGKGMDNVFFKVSKI